MSETFSRNTLFKEALLSEALLNEALLNEDFQNEPLEVRITNNSNSDLVVEPGKHVIPPTTQAYEVQHWFDMPLFIMTVEAGIQKRITLDSLYGCDLNYDKLMDELLWILTYKNTANEVSHVAMEEAKTDESSGGPNVTIGGNG